MPTITQHEMDRAKLVSEAGGHLLSAMDKFTAEHEELTAMEWIKAINDSLMRNLIAHQIKEEWSEPNA